MNVTHLSAVKDVQAEAHAKHQMSALVSSAGLDLTALSLPVNSCIIVQVHVHSYHNVDLKMSIFSPCISGNGKCVGPDTCKCNDGWGGQLCSDFDCSFGNRSGDCSSNGNCTALGMCACNPGYCGNDCQYPSETDHVLDHS